jgi:predicted anti-sigma-YlaC factor YlaD
MSEHITDTSFQCGDGAALVAYLYDECEPRTRDAIAAHVSTCPACAAEIEALGATRRMLPAWAPPEAPLGFQVRGTEASTNVLRPPRWWQRPLPAWAQAVAAVAIFAAGLSAGRVREANGPSESRVTSAPAAAVDAPPASAQAGSETTLPARLAATAAVSHDDLARLERELRTELARIEQAQRAERSEMVRAADALPASTDEAVTLERVEALIQQSERRQRGELIQGMAQVLSDVENQQLRYLAPIQRTVEGLSREAVTNRSSVAALANVVSIQRGFRPVGGR